MSTSRFHCCVTSVQGSKSHRHKTMPVTCPCSEEENVSQKSLILQECLEQEEWPERRPKLTHPSTVCQARQVGLKSLGVLGDSPVSHCYWRSNLKGGVCKWERSTHFLCENLVTFNLLWLKTLKSSLPEGFKTYLQILLIFSEVIAAIFQTGTIPLASTFINVIP